MKPLSAALNTTQPGLTTSSAWAYPGYALFFLMLFVPTVYQPIKAVLILIVLLTIALKVYRNEGRIDLHPSVLFWTWLLTAVGLFFIIRGFTRGAPGALRVSTVHVIWPWLYLVFVAATSTNHHLKNLIQTLLFALMAINLYSFQYILYELGYWPASLYFELDQGQVLELYSGYVEYNLYSISSLIYLVPFVTAALMTWTSAQVQGRFKSPSSAYTFFDSISRFPLSRRWLWFGLIPGLMLVLLSGRRALMLCAALAPLITIFFQLFLPSPARRRALHTAFRTSVVLVVLAIGGFTYLQQIYEIDLIAIYKMFSAGFDFGYDPSGSFRAEQFHDLIQAWLSHPFLGSGLGASLEAARMDTIPWSYELQYVSLLAHTGLVGVTFYGLGITWIYYSGIRIIRNGTPASLIMLPILVGTTCFLIATGTNQYIGKYDYIWTIFLPILLINQHLQAERMQ